MDQPARYSPQSICLIEDLVRLEPRVGRPTMRYLPSESQAKPWIRKSRIRQAIRCGRNVNGLPFTPCPRRRIMNGGIRVHQQSPVCLHESQVTQLSSDEIPEGLPFVGTVSPDTDGDPVDVRRGPKADGCEHERADSLGIPFGIRRSED